jgi:HK97 family phage prohead protease
VIAVPYNQETVVPHEGRVIAESFAPGSFTGIERRASRVRVNREHDRMYTCGKAVAFHPSRTEGLVADIVMFRTSLGDETLELAADGGLDASIAFAPFCGHEGWSSDRRSRRISKAWLAHIAMTSEPAYEGAQVLSVRNGEIVGEVVAVPSGTPNFDVWRSMQLADRYDVLFTR